MGQYDIAQICINGHLVGMRLERLTGVESRPESPPDGHNLGHSSGC